MRCAILVGTLGLLATAAVLAGGHAMGLQQVWSDTTLDGTGRFTDPLTVVGIAATYAQSGKVSLSAGTLTSTVPFTGTGLPGTYAVTVSPVSQHLSAAPATQRQTSWDLVLEANPDGVTIAWVALRY